MSYEPLHHKYRPQTFADLVGQEAIATTLTNAIVNNKIAPAYLFTGPRGTGKTSSARILAKSLNCLSSDRPTANPCGQCEVCFAIARSVAMDVIEIDAASNTGVDNIREIIERAQFAPVQCRYKVYAIDECHMLSTAAFNALLKTLEEPPARVVFVLATTDSQRVLPTIISRCQRFDYRRIPIAQMISHLRRIADREQIDITNEAITLVGQIANGGLRDAQSLLDQLSLLTETITPERVWDLVGIVPERDLLILLKAIKNSSFELVLEQCRHLLDRGREPLVILQNLAGFYLNLLIAKTSPSRHDLVALTEPTWQELCTEAARWSIASILQGQQHLKDSEIQLKNSTQPRLWLEVTLLGLLTSEGSINLAAKATEVGGDSRSIRPKVETEQETRVSNHTGYLPESQSKPNSDRVGSETNSVKLASSVVANIQPTLTESKIADRASDAVASSASLPTQPLSDRVNSAESNLGFQKQPVDRDLKPDTDKQKATEDLTTVDRETSIATNNTEPEFDIQEIWAKVIASVHPPMTQVLLRQQCNLIYFANHSARIAISSSQLLKLNQNKVPNIEAAFAKVCQRKVKVSLEVAGARSTQTTSERKTSVEQKQQDRSLRSQPDLSTSKPNFSPHLVKALTDVVESPTKTELSVDAVEASQSDAKSKSETQNIARPNQTLDESPNNNHTFVDEACGGQDLEIDKAIENLIKSFEGEAIDMGDRADKYLTDKQPQQELESDVSLNLDAKITSESLYSPSKSPSEGILSFEQKEGQKMANIDMSNDNDDDIPFVRSVDSKILAEGLLDSYEIYSQCPEVGVSHNFKFI